MWWRPWRRGWYWRRPFLYRRPIFFGPAVFVGGILFLIFACVVGTMMLRFASR